MFSKKEEVNTILIVDDKKRNISVLEEILLQENYKIKKALSGKEAIEIVNKKQPDLILLDILMPEMDGYETCRKIKSIKKNQLIPVIFISATSELIDKVKAFKAGGIDYIARPFQIEEVLMRVKTHLDLYRLQLHLKDSNVELLKQFKNTFDQVAVGIAHANPNDGQFIKVNQCFASMFGYEIEELLKLKIADLVDPDDLKTEKSSIKKLLNKSIDSYIHEIQAKHKDGSAVWVKVTVSLVTDAEGKPSYLASIIENISERKAAELKLRKSEKIFRGLMETSTDGIIIVNDKFEIINCNQQCYKLFAYSCEELYKKKIEFLIPKNLRTTHREHRKEFMKSPSTRMMGKDIELKGLRKDGTTFYIEVGINPLQTDDGLMIAISIRDINERKKLTDSLKENTILLTEAQRLAHLGSWVWDIKNDSLEWSDELYKIFGVSKKTFKPSLGAYLKMVHPDDRKIVKENINNALDNKETLQVEERIIRPDGELRYLKSWGTPISNESGFVHKMIGACLDITESKIQELRIRKNEERLKEAQDLAKIGNWELDLQKDSLYWSDGIFNIFDIDQNEFEATYEAFVETIHPEDRDMVNKAYLDHIHHKTPYNIEHRIQLRDGSVKYIREYCSSEFDSDGKAIKSIGSVQDITESKLAENKLKESEQKFRNIFENSVVGFYRTTPEGEILMVNNTLSEMLGYKNSEELKKTKLDSSKFEKGKPRSIFLNRIQKSGKVIDLESEWIKKDGSKIIVSESARAVFDKSGNIRYFDGSVVDISERKKAEEKLAISEKRYKSLFDAASDAIFIMKDDRFIECNEKTLDMFACTRKQILDSKPYIFSPERQYDNSLSKDSALLKIKAALKGKTQFFEWKHKRYDNSLFDAEVSLNKLELSTGTYIQAIVRDITARKKAEEEISKLNEELEEKVKKRTSALMQSEQKFRDIAELLPQAIFETDMKGQLTYTNKYGYSSTGYSKTDIKRGINIKELVPVEEHQHLQKNFQNRLKGKPSGANEYTLIHKKGEHIPVLIYSSVILKDRKPVGLRGVLINIADRKRAEQEITKLSEAIIQSPTTVVITDPKGNIEYVNPRFTELTGYSLKEALGKNPRILNAGIFSSDYFRNMWKTIKSGKTWQGEFCNKKKNGEIFWEWASISSIKDKNNKITHYIAVKEDITVRKQMEEELKAAKDEADAANKAKSEFLANMSHEIRTPMNAVLGFSELLGKLVKDDVQKNYLESIKSSGKSLLALINDILDLSKIEAGKLELQHSYVNLRSLFQEMKIIFQLKFEEKGLDFVMDIDENIPALVYVDETRLRQIILNLLSNAIKFTDQGLIKLHTMCTLKISKRRKKYCNLMIEVEDTGVGIPHTEKHKIFDSFTQKEGQSTKKYGGTGLGLSISNELVKLMNGKIEVISSVGSGSTFRFTLNKVLYSDTPSLNVQISKPATENIEFKGSKILVVDDIEDNRKFLVGALQDFDLKILEASNGKEALKMIKQQNFDLILTDLKMPVIDGFQLIKHIRNSDTLKELPVIAISASVMKKSIEKIKEHNFSGFLMKPFQISDLLAELIKFIPYYHTDKSNTDTYTIPDEIIAFKIHAPESFLNELSTLDKHHEKLKDQQAMNDVETFAKNCLSVANKYKIPGMINYSKMLVTALDSFDIEQMLSLIQKYPQLVQQLKQNIKSTK